MNAILSLLQMIDGVVSRTARAICIVALMAIFVMFMANVFVRFVPVYNFTQTDDWIQICLIWMIFLAAQELVRTRSHFVVDVLTERLRGTPLGRVCRVIVCVIELVMYAVICWYGWVWVMRAQAYMQSIPWLQMRVAYAAIPVSAFFMTCYGIRDLFEAVRNLIRGHGDIEVLEEW
ncbi:TRAP transporter small permease [Sutterella sp.]|uniref:TRAP transporter small permease n=1 Tax=Sutterella sp. TaxID=1981025 RepID=UPI0026E03A10|nr:TRAP transporter small permease [Sutterella sp.]MDO5532021.1 TRAP transporter small permease [Sutterella sp.]